MSYSDITTAARAVRGLLNETGDDPLNEVEEAAATLVATILDQQIAVWVVTITHEYGMDVRVNSSYGDAMDTVYRFAADNWEREMAEQRMDGTDDWGEPLYVTYVPDLPLDKAAVISEYFDRMEGQESYDVTQAIIGM
jgi:hypothetical protein